MFSKVLLNEDNLKTFFGVIILLFLISYCNSNPDCTGDCINGDGKKILKAGNKYTIENAVMYEGSWKNGKPNGTGTMTFSDGRKISGQWEGYDIKEHVKITFANGDKFVAIGKWKDDDIEEPGKRGFSYERSWWDKGKLNGGGSMTLGGKKYMGVWKRNVFIEDGHLMIKPNGDQYIGEFEYKNKAADQYEWHGTIIYANGDKATGAWKGKATYLYDSMGYWKQGELEGYGAYTKASGDKYVGNFKNGKYDGRGTIEYINGDKFIGEFKNGKRDGKGIEIYSDGEKIEGVWLNGGLVKQ